MASQVRRLATSLDTLALLSSSVEHDINVNPVHSLYNITLQPTLESYLTQEASFPDPPPNKYVYSPERLLELRDEDTLLPDDILVLGETTCQQNRLPVCLDAEGLKEFEEALKSQGKWATLQSPATRGRGAWRGGRGRGKSGRGRGDLHVSLDPSRGSNTSGNGVKGKEDASKLPRWMTQSADHFMLSTRSEESSANNSNLVNPPPTAVSTASTIPTTNSLKTSNSSINNSLSSSTNALHTVNQPSKDSSTQSDSNNDPTQDGPVSWVYIGDRGEIQGPFTSEKMLNWFNKKLLPLTLQVKRTNDTTFSSLAELSHSGTRNPFESHPVHIPSSTPNPLPQNPNPLRSSMPSLSKLQHSSPFNPIPLSNDILDPSSSDSGKNSVYDFQSLMGITDAIENHVAFPQEDMFLSRFAPSANQPNPDTWNNPSVNNPGMVWSHQLESQFNNPGGYPNQQGGSNNPIMNSLKTSQSAIPMESVWKKISVDAAPSLQQIQEIERREKEDRPRQFGNEPILSQEQLNYHQHQQNLLLQQQQQQQMYGFQQQPQNRFSPWGLPEGEEPQIVSSSPFPSHPVWGNSSGNYNLPQNPSQFNFPNEQMHNFEHGAPVNHFQNSMGIPDARNPWQHVDKPRAIDFMTVQQEEERNRLREMELFHQHNELSQQFHPNPHQNNDFAAWNAQPQFQDQADYQRDLFERQLLAHQNQQRMWANKSMNDNQNRPKSLLEIQEEEIRQKQQAQPKKPSDMLRASTNSAWNSPWNNVPMQSVPVQTVQPVHPPQQQAPPQQFGMNDRWNEPTELENIWNPQAANQKPEKVEEEDDELFWGGSVPKQAPAPAKSVSPPVPTPVVTPAPAPVAAPAQPAKQQAPATQPAAPKAAPAPAPTKPQAQTVVAPTQPAKQQAPAPAPQPQPTTPSVDNNPTPSQLAAAANERKTKNNNNNKPKPAQQPAQPQAQGRKKKNRGKKVDASAFFSFGASFEGRAIERPEYE